MYVQQTPIATNQSQSVPQEADRRFLHGDSHEAQTKSDDLSQAENEEEVCARVCACGMEKKNKTDAIRFSRSCHATRCPSLP